MNLWKMLCASMLLLLLAISLSQPIAHGDYNIALDRGEFRVVWRINAWQNLTGFSGVTGTVLPGNMSISLDGNDLSAFTASLQKALQAKVSTVTVDRPSVEITSNSPTYSCPAPAPCPLQWLNVTARFQVRDNPRVQAGVTRYDLSWKAFRLDQDLQAGGLSFNDIGEKYLVRALVPFVSFPNGIGRSMSVTVGTLPVSTTTYQALTRNIVLLDASPLQTPLENWNLNGNTLLGTQTWTSPKTGGFNILAALHFTEAQSVAVFSYIARAQFSAEVSAPIGASVKGDMLFVDTTGNLWEKTGLSLIVVMLGILTGTVILERRIVGDTRARRKNKKDGKH